MTEKTTVPAIYEKIALIRKEMPTLQKNGVGPSTQGSYKFLSIDDILDAVVPLENKHGVISYPLNHSVEFHYNAAALKDDGRVARENVQALTDFTFRYVAVEDGSFIDVSVPGEGIDSQDKATRKATTQAQKIANILTYNLITGEVDPDAVDGGRDAQEAPTAPTPRALNNARSAPQPAPGPVQTEAQKKIREVYIDNPDSTVTKEFANKVYQEEKANKVHKGDSTKIWDAVLARFEKGEVG